MIFKQFVDEDLGCASYLIGDSGVAVVVDPSFTIEQYLAAAAELDVRIERVLETHTHADHVSGHGRFALEHSVPVGIHSLAEAEYPHEPLADGDVVRVGDVEIRVLHTPGHRPEHCAFVVDGKIALTGDSLFVGDAARPDLAIAAREGAEDLFHSLRKLEALGDDVEVFPGHVAGSLCGGKMSSERSTTIRKERASNEALGFTEVQEFVMASASVTTPKPPTTERVVGLNRGPWVALPKLPSEVADTEATVLDVRDFGEYAAGHAHGAINVPVSGSSFGTKAGFVLLADEPFVIHASSREQAETAAWKLWAVGLLDIAGYVLSTPSAETLATVDIAELKAMLDADAVQVVDVREAYERDEAYIPG
ncbi:MAG TPA: MBL fold metallo-hydrolase, partial [Gaiellaceae bacterium]|nr:MBL fold metallo-hydrolase [Gaiellaceae bacterium]